jgi:hypothetical protein
VEADFSIELGRDDPALELPWSGENGIRYYDLKAHPELLASITEAQSHPELRDFLQFINGPASPLESAKCDAWSSTEIHPEEQVFQAEHKFGSYVDLLFSDAAVRFSLTDHEQFSRRAAELLRRAPEFPASAEFIVRRCYYHEDGDSRAGFYITCYVSGFGDDAERACQQWGIGLKLVENAIRQLLVSPRS